jgi:hypothetical protein
MTDKEYFEVDAMSQSAMKVFLESPRLYYLTYIEKSIESKKTPSLQFGTCIDLALTDREAYEKLTVKNSKTTTMENCITSAWKFKIDKMLYNLHSYKFDDEYFDGATFEQVIANCTTQDKLFYDFDDVKWKAKLDFMSIKSNCFIDLKSTRATTLEEFIKDFYNFGYHLQAGSYANAMMIKYNLSEYPEAYYIAISTVTGEIFVIHCTKRMLELGIMEITRGNNLYKKYRDNNLWEINKKPILLDLPTWLENKILKGAQNEENNNNW